MIYMRGQARDYDGWGAGDGYGANPGWSWDECLPVLPASTRTSTRAPTPSMPRPASTASGERAGGEWRVEKQRLRWDDPRRLPPRPRRGRHPAHATTSTAATTKASATSSVNQRAGIRWNATKAFLRPAFERAPNLQVWTGAHIDRVAARRRRPARRGVEDRAARRRRARSGAARARRRGHPRDRRDRHARRSCSSRASAPAALLQRTASRSRTRCRRRREPAGPPADPRGLRRRGRADAEHDGRRRSWGKAHDRPALRLEAQRADEHGAVAARRLHAQPTRRWRTRTSSTTCSRCRSMPSASRCIAFDAFTASVCNLNPTSRGQVQHPLGRHRRRAAHRARLPERPTKTATIAAEQPARDAPHRRPAGAGAATSRASSSRACSSRATPSSAQPRRRHRHDDLPPGRHRQDGPGGGPDGGGRRAPARARRARAARGRCQRHADDHQRQHQRADADDRRARRRMDPAPAS